MLDALYTSAIGLRAQQEQLDVVATNLSNVNTPAFKRQSVDFSAVLDRTAVSGFADVVATTDMRPGRVRRFDPTPGDLKPTGRALDVAIGGVGFLEVELPNGQTGYSRAGSLQVNAEGGLSLSSGHVLKADIRIPSGAGNAQIGDDGAVSVLLPGDRSATVIGHIELAMFSNPEALLYRGEGIFTAPEGMDDPIRVRPGEGGAGRLAAGRLEGSNVKMVDEMVSLMLMQRVYELNSRVAQVADELMGMSNNLRRG